MATAIPPEAIDRYRVLEQRAEAARALSESLRHRADHLRSEESNLRVNLHDYFSKAAVNSRIEIAADGTITYHAGARVSVLAEKHPTALRLVKTQAAIVRTRAEQAEHSASSGPVLQLAARCREALTARQWDGF